MRVEIRADVFYRAVKSTAFAASRDFDPRRPALSGVLLEATPKTFRVVATDGYRLALFESDDGHDCPEPLTAVLLAGELAGLNLPRASGDTIRIAVNGAEVAIQCEKAAFNVPVIQADYPNYLAVFPPVQDSITLHCEKKQFVEALTNAKRETTRNNRNVFFWTRPGFIAVSAENAGTIAPEKVTAQCEHSTFGVLNCNYLLDAVRSLPAGDVRMRFVLPSEGRLISSALEISPVGSHNVIRHLVMPCWRPFVYALPGFDS
jgi:DNA polymerase III sliding clamp (beta) subunit (PCNA family)